MKYKYRLPDALVEKASYMREFASGGTQVTVRLKNGQEVPEVLLSNSANINNCSSRI